MEKALLKSHWWAYAQTNWLKILIFGVCCFIFLNKDFTFQLNLNAPLEVEEAVEERQPLLKSRKAAKKTPKEKLTEQAPQRKVATTNTSGVIDNLPQKIVPVETQSIAPIDYTSTGEIDEWAYLSYIDRFSHVAIAEQQKYHIPASIILANGLFHSFAGQREITLSGNNHFGLKCTSGWKGKKRALRGSCFRSYESSWESFRDHSRYLTKGKFVILQEHGSTDYKSWAEGLEKLKYADQLKMSSQLIELIERYKLYQYDLAGI